MLDEREKNKLIVQFMDYPTCSDYWKDGRFEGEDYKDYHYIHGQFDSCWGSSNFDVSDMCFSTSWDWLMPVIEKIYSLDSNVDFFKTININNTYNEVVEFIKEYNNGKN
tara:strand:+ start:321 stop:647 length:327 start_codon:yes stop_codon:yes gene_type:complete